MIRPSQQNFIKQLSVDCVVFGYSNKQLKVLVPKLSFKGDYWTLPGGYILQEESIDEAAKRVLKDRTGIKDIFLEQFRVFGEVPRKNVPQFEQMILQNREKFGEEGQFENELNWITQRFISIGYYALVDSTKVRPQRTEIDESVEWYEINKLPNMILDHQNQVAKALEMLRINFDRKLIWYNLLPDHFTMKELQSLYETVYAKPFRRNNFQKKILDLNVLERLGKKYTGAANKAPYLYRFKKR